MLVALDTETWLIQPGRLAPPLVCGSMMGVGGEPQLLGIHERDPELPDVIDTFVGLLDGANTIVGANIAYDVLVIAVAAKLRGLDLMPAIVAAYEADRFYDVQLAEQLHAIGRGLLGEDLVTNQPLKGRYSLATCAEQVLARSDAKAHDEWRLRYHELDEIPIRDWPELARVYPLDDARNTLEIALAQQGHAPSRDAHRTRPDGVCERCGLVPEVSTCWAREPRMNLHDQATQVRKALALHLGAAWGLRAMRSRVEALAAAAADGVDHEPFVAAGFERDNGTENQAVVKRACARAYGAVNPCAACNGTGKSVSVISNGPVNCSACSGTGYDLDGAPSVPRTPIRSVSIGRDALSESGDELLMAYAESSEDAKVLTTYVPTLLKACETPLNLRPNPLLDTGRVSYTGVEQTFPRRVSKHLSERLKEIPGAPRGVRDCFEARPGKLYYSVDYTGGELVTFAESCKMRVGFSDLGAALIAGIDAHSAFAATMLGVDYESFVARLKSGDKRAKDARQAAKPANFGFPGGMGAVQLALNQRRSGPDTPHTAGPARVWDGKAWVPGYKGMRFCVLIGQASECGTAKVTEWNQHQCPPLCKRCIECATTLKATWLRQWREAQPYLAWHAQNSDQVGRVEQLYSGRIRGGAGYCAEANGDFQALLADIAGRAQWRVTREQYTDRASPLYGSRSILFAHDELFGECGESVGHEVAMRVHDLMIEEFKKGCPNHAAACKAEPTLMRAWHKDATPVWCDGRLVEWVP